MSGGNGIKEKITSLSDETKELVSTAVKLAKAEVTIQASKAVSNIIVYVALFLLVNYLLLFLAFGAAMWIGDVLEDSKLGFFIVGGFFLLVIIIILAMKKKVIIPYFRNNIVQKLYD